MRMTLLLAAGSLLVLSAGTGVASATVSAADLQQWLATQLSTPPNPPPDSVVCPADLDTVVGASITCAVTRGDETRGVTITVDSVDNDTIGFSLAPARQ